MKILSPSVWRPRDQGGRIPAIGECDVCRNPVTLAHFTNTCDKCGADYNSAGQHLAPREQWGEDTGEHWTECIGPFPDESEGDNNG